MGPKLQRQFSKEQNSIKAQTRGKKGEVQNLYTSQFGFSTGMKEKLVMNALHLPSKENPNVLESSFKPKMNMTRSQLKPQTFHFSSSMIRDLNLEEVGLPHKKSGDLFQFV